MNQTGETPNLQNVFEQLLRKRSYQEMEDKCEQLLHKDPEDYLGLTYKGMILQVRNKFSKSKKLLKQAIELEPERATAYHWMGTLKTKKRKFERALEFFESVFSIDSSFVRSKIYRAYIFRLKRDYEKALGVIEEAKRIDPGHPMIWNELGNIQMDQKNYPEAEESFRKALELGPECIDVYDNLANLLKIRGDFQGSFDLYAKALEINPKDPKTINGVGCVHVRKREYALAEENFQKVLEENSHYVSAYLNLGIIRRTRGKMDEALELYDLVEKENPYNATVWNFRGNIYLDKKMYARSRECFERAISVDPFYVNGYTSLSNLHKIQKDFDKSEELCNLGLETCGKASELLNALANLCYDRKEYDRAEELYKESAGLDRYYSSPFLNMGCIYKIRKQFDRAIELFDKTLEIYEYSVSALNNKAGVYMDQKDFARAREIYLKTLELDPFYSYPYMNLGNICKTLLQFDEAMEYYRKGLSFNPLHLPTLSSKAGCFFSMGNYPEALAGFRKLLELDDKNKYYYSNIGMCYLNMEDLESALEWMDKGIQRDPKDGGIKFRKGLVLFKLKRDSEFRELFTQMIAEGRREPEDVNKNLLNGYKLQVVYMKSRKQYSTGLEVCDKILAMDELEIGTLVDKMYMMNECRQNKQVLALAESLLQKFPKNKNVLYQMGVAAMFEKNYEKGRDCFQQVVEISPKNISAFKNLFVCYKHNDQAFEQLEILNRLKQMKSPVLNHLNEENKVVKKIISRGECLKKEEKGQGVEPKEDDHPFVAKEIREINKLELTVPPPDDLLEFAFYCHQQNSVQSRLRILKKYRSQKKFNKVKEKYEKLLDSFKLKKKKLKKHIKLFSLKVEKMSNDNSDFKRLINKKPENKLKWIFYFLLFRPRDKIEDEEEALGIATQILVFLKDFIRHSLKLDTIVTESHFFGRRHAREEGFNVKSRFHYDFFDQPLLHKTDLLENNSKYFEFFMHPIQKFPTKVSEFDLARKYWICFKGLAGINFVEVLFYLFDDHSIHQLFVPNQNMLYGDNCLLILLIETAMTGHYSFDFDLSGLGGYLAFIIFEKLCGIVERSVIEQKSGAELTQLLGEEVLINAHDCQFRRFNEKSVNLSSKYICQKMTFESFDPQLKALKNKVEVTVSDTQIIQVVCQGQRTRKIPLHFECTTLFGKKNKRYVRVHDGHDSLLKSSVYRLDLDIWIDNDKEEELEVWRTIYLKEKRIRIPKGMIKMFLKRVPEIRQDVVQDSEKDPLRVDQNDTSDKLN